MRTPLPQDVRSQLRESYGLGAWNVAGAVTGTKAHVRASRKAVRDACPDVACLMRVYEDRTSGQSIRIDLEGIFVQIGLVPNTEWLKDTIALSPRGEIEIVLEQNHSAARPASRSGKEERRFMVRSCRWAGSRRAYPACGGISVGDAGPVTGSHPATAPATSIQQGGKPLSPGIFHFQGTAIPSPRGN